MKNIFSNITTEPPAKILKQLMYEVAIDAKKVATNRPKINHIR
jgi:hypothetical protein